MRNKWISHSKHFACIFEDMFDPISKSDLVHNIQQLALSLKGKPCTVIAVTKTHPIPTLQLAYDLGLKVFGENKVQEMAAKYEALPKDIQWHMIGHLQRNKVKYIAPFVSLIHSIDSLELLCEVDKQAAKHKRIIPYLLQIHIAQEESKFGFTFEEASSLITQNSWKNLSNVKLIGLMGMATNTENVDQIRLEFNNLNTFFKQMKITFPRLEILSMGMSNDYPIALEEGSTMIRVGSALFGARS